MAKYEILQSSEIEYIANMVNTTLTQKGLSLNKFSELCHVSQPMAYAAQKGRIKRRTPSVKRVELYIHIALGLKHPELDRLHRELDDYVLAGGDLSTLSRIMDGLIGRYPRQD